jgi:hypothetical protein
MTKYLLDTGPLAAHLLGRPGIVPLMTGWLAYNQATTSIVVYGEVIEYLKGLPHYQRYRRQLLQLMPTIPPHALSATRSVRRGSLRPVWPTSCPQDTRLTFGLVTCHFLPVMRGRRPAYLLVHRRCACSTGRTGTTTAGLPVVNIGNQSQRLLVY